VCVVVRQHALRQVVQESAGTDLEYRERKAVYTYKVAQLRQNIDALRKVLASSLRPLRVA
jgi:hypothetical protein